eukprot:862223-Lingulodinium_polyedra.AAC.1
MRVLPLRDVFHREWNDTLNAVKGCGLYWVLVCSTLLYNLPYGPWDGAGWFDQLQEAAGVYWERATVQDPLFQALYPA